MTEFEAYRDLIIMGGLVLSMPFFYRVCYIIGKLFIIKFFPPEFITIEVKRKNGEIVLTKVKTNDNKALTEALLRTTGKRLF